jgi:type II secretory pathway component GspD/PulD (secretin)
MAKKNKPVEAAPDIALLRRMYDEGGLYLSQTEGSDIVASGFAKVDFSNTEGDKALVMLTDKGANLVVTTRGNVAAISSKTEDDTKMDNNKLEVGGSFHVSNSGNKTSAETLKAIASSMTGAKRKFAVADGSETVTVKTYQKDANGKRVKPLVVTGTETVTRPKLKDTRNFVAAVVDAADPDGEGVRVWRDR